jgi:glycosyltransferase involved in cell wall biosynthesis
MSGKRKRVLYMNLYTEMGGGENAVYEIVKGLDRSRFRPIMVFNRRGPFVEEVEKAGIETVILPYPSVMLKKLIVPGVFRDVLRASRVLKTYVREQNIDCLHCVDVLSLILLARTILTLRIPVAYNVIFFYERTRIILFNILAIVLVKEIVANSQAIRNDLLRRTVLLAGKTKVIYYGVDVRRFRPSTDGESSVLRRELRLSDSTKLVGMIARYDVWKGHSVFLKAAASVLKQRSDVKFVIVGGLLNAEIILPLQRYYDSVMAERRSLDLEKDVVMLPHRADIPEVLRALDVFVCPSKREPIPLIVFEAMASGVPVVAADSGGIPEQICPGTDGLLFRTDDAESLERAILQSLDDREGNRVMTRSARTKVETQFTVARFVREMEQVYEGVMRSAPKAA